MPLSACKTAERIAGYTVREQIGAGGYGEVWKADAPGGLTKAIKFVYGHLDGERAACELKALNRIKEVRHPFLLSLERIEVVNGQLVIITELADWSLKDRYEECKKTGLPGIPRNELLVYMRDAADALDYMSEKFSLQHLDIKPENLLVVGGRVKVADFGLVKDVHGASVSLMGGLTLVYASPEVFDGCPSLHSDQYSLAIVYQEMLTGLLPFPGKTPAQLTSQHLHSRPQLTPLPESDRETIARALAKGPQHRFPSCREMIDSLVQGRPGGAKTSARVSELPGGAPTLVDTASLGAQTADTSTRPKRESKPASRATEVLTHLPRPSPPPGPGAPEERLPRQRGAGLIALPPIEVAPEEVGLRPTLVVGIGGTAARTLRRLHRRLHDRFEDLAAVPALQLLLVDTDAREIHRATQDDGIGLAPQHTLTMPLRQRQQYREDSDEFLRWLSRRWLYNIPRSLQTEGLRPLGRLALIDHTAALFGRLRAALAAMTDAEALVASSEKTGMAVRNSVPRVFIVSSISGGTGSGMVLDMAYAARMVLADAGLVNETVCGILTHSTIRSPDAKDLAVANAYACLKELHHFSRVGRYPGNPASRLPAYEENVGAFDDAYLIHLGDDLGEAEFQAATDAVAEYLYLDIATGGGAFFDKCRQSTGRSTDSRRPPPQFRSFSLAQLGCSTTAIPSAATSLLCKQVVQRWCGKTGIDGRQTPRGSGRGDPSFSPAAALGGPASSGPTTAAPQGADALRLSWDALFAQVYAGVRQELGDDVKNALQNCLQQGADSSPDESADALRPLPFGEVLQRIDTLLGRYNYEDELSEPFDGLLQQPLAGHVKALASERAAEVRDWVFQLADTSAGRVREAQRAVDWTSEQLRSLRAEADLLLGRIRANIAHVEQCLAALSGGERRRRRRWLAIGRASREKTELERRWLQYFDLRLNHLVLQAACSLLRSLQGRMLAVGDELKLLIRELNVLAEQFDASTLLSAATDVSSSDGPFQRFCSSAAKTLCQRMPELVVQLDEQVYKSFFAEHAGLQAVLQKKIELDGAFSTTLRQAARAVIVRALNQIDAAGLLLADEAAPKEPNGLLDSFLDLAKPPRPGCDGSQRLMLVCPQGAAAASLQEIIRDRAQQQPSVIHDRDSDLVLCYEIQQLSLGAMAADLIAHRPDYAEIASRLHTRIDITWTPLPRIEQAE
ncbi:MAG: protein kinase [Pirellulales bacterium]|nr:protein kinase [Pirellulales bacterium]